MTMTRHLLYNLAYRLRKARQQRRMYSKLHYGGNGNKALLYTLNFYEGAENEAWNSFQAAKAIVYGEGE